jgi:ribosomal protein S18 acetylase RimI-like enzyme
MSEFADPDAAGLRMLAVGPQFQGAGAGRALTEACIARARGEGRRRIVLHSTPVMEVARAMYERLGFVATPGLDLFVTRPPYSDDEPLRLIAYVLEL